MSNFRKEGENLQQFWGIILSFGLASATEVYDFVVLAWETNLNTTISLENTWKGFHQTIDR